VTVDTKIQPSQASIRGSDRELTSALDVVVVVHIDEVLETIVGYVEVSIARLTKSSLQDAVRDAIVTRAPGFGTRLLLAGTKPALFELPKGPLMTSGSTDV
jgi:hypothetical protein